MRSLVIGYGNPSRRDDGVALHIINALRAAWRLPALAPYEDGWDGLRTGRDTLFLQQLAPELAAVVAEYDLVVFVDAAVREAGEAVRVEPVDATLRIAAVSHHLAPGALLALAQLLYGHAPEGLLLSVRGVDMDFGEALSPETAAAVPVAAQRVMDLIASREGSSAP